MEKTCKKAKWLSGDALQIAVKRREAKSKGEKQRYKHLNAEFQRIARRDKKAFFSYQCKEIEEGFLISPCYSLELCIQRIARRDNKAFLSDQCKETEENNRMAKTRDLFKKIRHTKGTFHARWAQ